VGQGADEVLTLGIDAVLSICPRPMPLEACMRDGGALIEAATASLCRVIRATRSMSPLARNDTGFTGHGPA
jgi:glycerate kinase